jgi:hypothetical protein
MDTNYLQSLELLFFETRFKVLGFPELFEIQMRAQVEENPFFDSWGIKWDDRLKLATLVLRKDGRPVVLLRSDMTGKWMGQAFSSGYITLVPQDNEEMWRRWWSVKSYVKSLEVGEGRLRPKKVLYREVVNDSRFDFSTEEYNIADDVNVDQYVDSKARSFAVGIYSMSGESLEDFKKTLDSSVAAAEAKNIPIFAFLDRIFKSNDDTQEGLLKAQACKAYGIPVVHHRVPWGEGRVFIDLFRQLFDNCKYKYVFAIRAGIQLPKDFFESVVQIDKRHKKYTNRGFVHSALDGDRLWDFFIGKDRWDLLKETVYEYEKLFLNTLNYSGRPHQSIKEWIKNKARFPVPFLGDTPLPVPSVYAERREKGLVEDPNTDIYTVFTLAADRAGLVDIFSPYKPKQGHKPVEIPIEVLSGTPIESLDQFEGDL